jgi:hypothetical protein
MGYTQKKYLHNVEYKLRGILLIVAVSDKSVSWKPPTF